MSVNTAAETQAQSQTVTVFDSQKVNIGTSGTQTSTGVVNKSIFWDPSKYALVKATATFTAGQSYLSGASAYFEINGSQAAPNLGWGAFATGQRTQTEDVTTQITNGSNSFNCWYKINYGTLSPESCTFSLSVQVTLQYIGPAGGATTNPVGSGSTTPSLGNIWAKIKGFFTNTEQAVIWIVVIAAVGLAIYEVTNLYSKGSLDSLISGAKKAGSKVKETASAAVAKAREGSDSSTEA